MKTAVEISGCSRTRPCPILVLGVGNLLLRDEGVGVHVVRAMQQMNLPETVEVVDGATAGFGLLDIIADRRKVIVVDAMDSDDPPGTVRRLSLSDLAGGNGQVTSLHRLGLAEVLGLSGRLGISPAELVILGVKPATLEYGLELSPELSRLLPRIVELVLREIGGQKGEDWS